MISEKIDSFGLLKSSSSNNDDYILYTLTISGLLHSQILSPIEKSNDSNNTSDFISMNELINHSNTNEDIKLIHSFSNNNINDNYNNHGLIEINPIGNFGIIAKNNTIFYLCDQNEIFDILSDEIITAITTADINQLSPAYLLHCYGIEPQRLVVVGCQSGMIYGISLPNTNTNTSTSTSTNKMEIIFKKSYYFPIDSLCFHSMYDDKLYNHLLKIGINGELVCDGINKLQSQSIKSEIRLPTTLFSSSTSLKESLIIIGHNIIMISTRGSIEVYDLLKEIWITVYQPSWGSKAIKSMYHIINTTNSMNELGLLLFDGEVVVKSYNDDIDVVDTIRSLSPLKSNTSSSSNIIDSTIASIETTAEERDQLSNRLSKISLEVWRLAALVTLLDQNKGDKSAYLKEFLFYKL